MSGKPRILIVDDEPDMLSGCANILASLGNKPVPVSDGRLAIDLITEEEFFEVTTNLESFEPVRKSLVETGLEIDNASLQWIAKNTTQVTGDVSEKVIKLIDMMEDSDDIQSVYTNADFQDE